MGYGTLLDKCFRITGSDIVGVQMRVPDYEEKNIQLYLGDCLELMKEIPNKSVDLVLTDPPYGVNLGNHIGANETRSGLLIKSGGYDDSVENFDRVVVPAIKQALSMSIRGMVFCVPPSMWKLPAPNAIGGIFVSAAVGRNKWGWSNFIHCLMYGSAPDLNLGAKPRRGYRIPWS